MADIEARIAELFTERLQAAKPCPSWTWTT